MKELIIQPLVDASRNEAKVYRFALATSYSDEKRAAAEKTHSDRVAAIHELKTYSALEAAISEAQGKCTARTIDALCAPLQEQKVARV